MALKAKPFKDFNVNDVVIGIISSNRNQVGRITGIVPTVGRRKFNILWNNGVVSESFVNGIKLLSDGPQFGLSLQHEQQELQQETSTTSSIHSNDHTNHGLRAATAEAATRTAEYVLMMFL
jgi:hypothetical protein